MPVALLGKYWTAAEEAVEEILFGEPTKGTPFPEDFGPHHRRQGGQPSWLARDWGGSQAAGLPVLKLGNSWAPWDMLVIQRMNDTRHPTSFCCCKPADHGPPKTLSLLSNTMKATSHLSTCYMPGPGLETPVNSCS